MRELSSCPSCQGFNPASTVSCLHCGGALSRRSKRGWLFSLWTAAGAGITAITLMACYGAPPCPDGAFDCYTPDPEEDLDAGTDGGLQDAGTLDGGLPDGGR
jgi:hypothetical protein